MKKPLALCILLTTVLVGCRNASHYNDIVKETYMHKYGVPIPKTDWESQGKEGQIVSLRKDGVTVTASYLHGVQDGVTTYTFPNSSTVQFVETFADGMLVSTRENYPSGIPMKEELYLDCALVQLSQWYEDGTPQANETYQNTFLLSGEYRTLLNVLESRVNDGHGMRICRSTDGELLSKDTIQNGQMTERITFYTNGDPETVTPYANGVIHGTRLTFLQGGVPNTVEQWIQGVQEGTTVLYQNGEKIAEIPYAQGKKNGIEYRYRDGTLLVEELSWKNDIQHGQRKIYIDGETKTEWYHEGELVSRTAFERLNLPRKIT
jgi:antitoxin component YwqK of YwqJK toxin-antitoxin module